MIRGNVIVGANIHCQRTSTGDVRSCSNAVSPWLEIPIGPVETYGHWLAHVETRAQKLGRRGTTIFLFSGRGQRMMRSYPEMPEAGFAFPCCCWGTLLPEGVRLRAEAPIEPEKCSVGKPEEEQAHGDQNRGRCGPQESQCGTRSILLVSRRMGIVALSFQLSVNAHRAIRQLEARNNFPRHANSAPYKQTAMRKPCISEEQYSGIPQTVLVLSTGQGPNFVDGPWYRPA